MPRVSVPGMGDGLVQARGLRKSFGAFEAVRGIDVDVAPGEVFGFLGPERRRQVVHHAHDRVRVAPSRRRAAGAGHGPGRRRPADPRADRRRPAAGQPRRRADGPGEPRTSTAATSASPGRRSAPRPTSCWSSRSSPTGPTRQGRAALGRHEAAADDRPLAGQRPRAAAARRADHRAGPAGPPRAVGPAVPAQAARASPWSLTTHYMDEAEQLCDRLVVMDGGRDRRRGLARRADPRARPPARCSSCGSPAGDHDVPRRGRRRRLAERVEALPDRLLLYTDDGEHRRRELVHAAGCGRCRRWCGARRWRTCSSGSPAGRWSTDDRLVTRSRASAAGARPPASAGCCWSSSTTGPGTGATGAARVSSARCCTPLLFLLAIGVGLGALIDGTGRAAQATGGVDYLVWLAPALLAASAVQTGGVRLDLPGDGRRSSGTSSTTPCWPPRSRRADRGRAPGSARVPDRRLRRAVFVAVMAAFGGVAARPGSCWRCAVACSPGSRSRRRSRRFAAGVAGRGTAFSVLFRLVLIPMFLFSGTFFPVDQLPAWAAAGRVGHAAVARRRARAAGCASDRAAGAPRSGTSAYLLPGARRSWCWLPRGLRQAAR